MVCNSGIGLRCVSPGCSMFVAVGEYRIVIRSYVMPVVLDVACYCVGVDRCVSFCMCPLLDTESVSSSGRIENETHLTTPTK